MTPHLGLSITATGPLFGTTGGHVVLPGAFSLDGATTIFNQTVQDVVEKLADEGHDRLFEQGQSKPAGLFLSVEEARQGHASGGNWRDHLVMTKAHLHATLEPGVEYGHWLEGEGTRNTASRFKGYHMFRQLRDWLEENAQRIAQPLIDRAVSRLNG